MIGTRLIGIPLILAATFALFPYTASNNSTTPWTVLRDDGSVDDPKPPDLAKQVIDLSPAGLFSFAMIVAAGTFIATDYIKSRAHSKERHSDKTGMDKEQENGYHDEQQLEVVENMDSAERIESTLQEIRRLKEAIGGGEQQKAPLSLIDRTKFQPAN